MEMGKTKKTNTTKQTNKKVDANEKNKNTGKNINKNNNKKTNKKNEQASQIKKTTEKNKQMNQTKQTNKKVITEPKKEEKVVKKENEIKKETPKIKEEKSELKKLFILIGIIAVLFIIFYAAITIANKNKLNKIFPSDDSLGETEFDYSKIMVGNMLTQNKDEYYVLAYKTEGNENNPYADEISEYESYKYEYKIYTIELNDVFNKKYVADESNFEDDNIVFSKTTLVKVKDGKIDSVYEDDEEISNTLDDLLEDAREKTE